MKQNNRPERIDHRSYEWQGINQIPTVHLGVAVSRMEKKGNSVDATATTGSDSKAYFKDIEIGTYTLEEVSPGNAYILPEPQTVTIPGNDIAYATMENIWKRWQATTTKLDADAGKPVPQGDTTLNRTEYTLYKAGKAVAMYTVSDGDFTTEFPQEEGQPPHFV